VALGVISDLHGAEPYATAQTLPDDVLLEIFKYHRLASLKYGPWKWYRLTQACRRWRFVVFAYPRLLVLRIVSTNKNPIRGAPDFWPPALPVIIKYRNLSAEDEDNILDILKNPARICEMDIDIACYQLVKDVSLLEESFPALEYLRLGSDGHATGAREALFLELIFPDNLLGNSAPRLRVLRLQGIVFPTLPRLLSTLKNLVSLQLERIPAERIFTAQDLAIGLSSATQLESLKIGIHGAFFPHPRLLTQNEHAPRTVLPALLEFQYVGESSYLNVFASRIDAPIIEQFEVTFCSEFGGHHTYELCELFGRGEDLRSSRCRRTHIRFLEDSVVFTHHFTRLPSSPGLFRVQQVDPGGLYDCTSLATEICLGFQSRGIMQKVTQFEIEGFPKPLVWYWKVGTERWLTLLGAHSGVKELHVVGTLALNVVSALSHMSGQAGVILPELRDLHLPCGLGTSAAVEWFIVARKLYNLPAVSIHYNGWE
jgi:hypothetical protein